MSLLRRRRSVRENEQKRTIWRSSVDFVMVCFGKISENIMLSPDQVKVWVALDNPIVVLCSGDCTAEDLCIQLCDMYKIPPLTRTLFALRIKGTDHFLTDNSVVSSHKQYELRIRFKVAFEQLAELGETTYEYYFRQVRYDLFHNAIPEIVYPDRRNDILGFGVTDMVRAILEEDLPIDTIDDNYKKYIPKVIVKNHGQCAQKRARDSLLEVNSRLGDPKYNINVTTVKKTYLEKICTMAPNYLAENYYDVQWHSGGQTHTVNLQISPCQGNELVIRMFHDEKWTQICSIEDLQSFTRRTEVDGLQISLKGEPYFFKFKSAEQLSSFISVCDGYYRLTVKWTFNLSKDDETPSLKKLSAIKCHGPVGGEFSFQKLELIGKNEHGAFILRQCQYFYNVYYLDVCGKRGMKGSYKLKYVKDNSEEYFVFNDKNYAEIDKLIKDYQDPESDIYLKNLIPPLEHDKSQLLLCSKTLRSRLRIDKSHLAEVLKNNTRPRCVEPAEIMVYAGTLKKSSSGIMSTAKALWKVGQGKEIDVAYKYFDANDYSEDFSRLAAKWLKVQSESIVRLYGIVLTSPVAMVFEYLPYGPLDKYLKEHASAKTTFLCPLNLMRVASTLAGALSTLSDAGVVHGHVRCRRLLVAGSSGSCIVVKLLEPSLRAYTEHDIPWLPPEYHPDVMKQQRPAQTVEGDIWAFATTVWEIFSYGEVPSRPAVAKIPAECSEDTWQLLRACWAVEPQARPRPQSIMRDMYNALYRDYRTDPSPCVPPILVPRELKEEKVPLVSLMPGYNQPRNNTDGQQPVSTPLTIHAIGTANQEKSCFVTPTVPYTELGKGNFGKVYLGEMWFGDDEKRQTKQVAVKELDYESDTAVKDFENELSIMQTVEHENIVRVLGHWIGWCMMGIVMEYMPKGSLQRYLKYTQLPPYNLIKYSLDIAEGMRYLSSRNIVHRDLAPRNILVEHPFKVKISDFGLSRRLSPAQSEYQISLKHELPINRYAPEAADRRRFSSQSDVWSYGITLWEIFTRGALFLPHYQKGRSADDWAHYVAKSFPKPADCPDNMYDGVMRRCWAIQPDARPTFAEIADLARDIYARYQRNQRTDQSNR